MRRSAARQFKQEAANAQTTATTDRYDKIIRLTKSLKTPGFSRQNPATGKVRLAVSGGCDSKQLSTNGAPHPSLGYLLRAAAFHGLTDGIDPKDAEAISSRLIAAAIRQGGQVHDIQIRHDSLLIWVQAHVTFGRDETLGQILDRLTAIETEMVEHFSEVRTLLHPGKGSVLTIDNGVALVNSLHAPLVACSISWCHVSPHESRRLPEP